MPDYCLRNILQYFNFYARSIFHTNGQVRILPGPATHPEPPPAPPDAKVYSSFPIKGGVDIKFELEGNTAQPGDVEVPVKVFITSDYEFIGYTIAGRFPTDSLELVRIEEQVRPGVENADNERGQFWAFMTNARRRVGAEGERVHVATLYFNVKAGAQGSIPITLETVYGPGSHPNWVNIRGMAESEEPITLQFEPLVITNGQLQIKEEGLTPRGDANFDHQVDLTDPVILLGYLFQGMSAPECPRAADFNLDGELNISDPVALLATLFLGAPRPGGDEWAEVPCQ
jgi:hypothetical protein